MIFFGFSEEDLARNISFGVAGEYLSNEDGVLDYVESLEKTAKNLIEALRELKQKIKSKQQPKESGDCITHPDIDDNDTLDL